MSSLQHSSSMEDLLPQNVTLNILSRLPVKAVIYCKCVCKKWRDLVSESYFVHLHLSRSREALMIHQCTPSDFFRNKPGVLTWVEIEHEADYNLDPVMSLDLEACDPLTRGLIAHVGSVNGLICCCRLRDSIYIFNPVFEQYMVLPRPRPEGGNLVQLGYGFGVSTAGEYKVIRICGTRVSSNPSEAKDHAVGIEVYTLGTDQWRILGQTPYRVNISDEMDPVRLLNRFDHGAYVGRYEPGAFVNSHVYWIIEDEIYDFDLVTETFELFPSPPAPQESKLMLGVLKGSLSRFSWCSLGLEVWVMKQGSWYNEIAIKENISPILRSRPLCHINGLKGASILMLYDKGTKELKAYCLDTNTIISTNYRGYYATIMTYSPSFVKLNNFGSERVHAMFNYGDEIDEGDEGDESEETEESDEEE